MPNILFKCRSCGHQLVVEDACAGMPTKCPNCRTDLVVPKTAINYTCPHSICSHEIKIDIVLKGDGLHCPSCNKSIMLPIQRADVIVCLCKRCEKIIEIPVSKAGKLLSCPKCDDWIMGPVLHEVAAASPANISTNLAPPVQNDSYSLPAAANTLPVLVVDDNKTDQYLMAVHLGKIGSFKREIELDFAMDGEEALAKLRKKGFALVVLDWNLPVLGQGEVLRELRRNGSRLPVVVITGVEPQHLANDLAVLKGTFLSKDQMSPETFHIAICTALALVGLNVSDYFAQRMSLSN